MTDNIKFFKDNVDFYSEEYRDYSLKPWERKIVDMVSGSDVLDVACGGGRVTVPLLRRGHNVIGTDFIEEFETKVKQHKSEFVGTFKFIRSDMTKLPFANDFFDSVICINSLVYLKNIEDVRKAIGEMSRVLKLSGKLYITTWNILHPYWGTSVVLNYLLRRGKRFGETSPFWATDSRAKNSRTYMFVPTKKVLDCVCREMNIDSFICTGREFIGSKSRMATFHPILVIAGRKS